MAFTIGTATFTNGSTSVTAVSLTSGKLSYFGSGTRMVVGVNPVIREVEAIAAPSVSTITLREAWPHATGTYAFLANMTSEGIRDAAQTLRTYVDGLSVAPTADTTAVRTSTGAIKAADGVNVDEAIVAGQLPDDVADLYAKNNILGTVSQSGGVPTGAIIERGSNANGEYVKYADGTLICWIEYQLGVDTNASVSVGGGYRTSSLTASLPNTMIGTNYRCIGNRLSGDSAFSFTVAPSSNTEVIFIGQRITSGTILSGTRASGIVIGRWY